MAKTIFPEYGFHLADLLSEDGVTLEINNDFSGIDENTYEYSNSVYMSNDEMLKFLNMGDLDSDEEDAGVDVQMPWNLGFDKLRSKMVDILGNGMVMKIVKREGVGEVIPENAQVSVRYIGYFEHQDEPFDASYNRGSVPDLLQLGQGAVIPGLEVALSSMRKHEIAVFLIKPEYAYGELGCLPRIPGNQEVLFVVHVQDFTDGELTSQNLTPEERKLFYNVEQTAKKIIATAFQHFKRGRIKQAIAQYSKAADVLEKSHLANEIEEEQQKCLLTRIYGNLAVCFNRENKPRSACTAFNQIPIHNAKSYFNHGRALIRLGEFEKAQNELMISKRMEPKTRAIVQELNLAKELESKYNSIESRLEKNCFLFTSKESVSPEFENAAEDLCRTLQSDMNVLKMNLPGGLTVDEDQCIRTIAINYDLLVVNQQRCGKETVFLAKRNY